jgi:hypothetical protein
MPHAAGIEHLSRQGASKGGPVVRGRRYSAKPFAKLLQSFAATELFLYRSSIFNRKIDLGCEHDWHGAIGLTAFANPRRGF